VRLAAKAGAGHYSFAPALCLSAATGELLYSLVSPLERPVQQSRPFALACPGVGHGALGSSFIALKLAFAEWPAMWVIFARMAIGSLVFRRLALARAHRLPSGRLEVPARPGHCEPCLYFVCESFALQYTSAAQAGMITALLPLLVAVGAFLLLRERISPATPGWASPWRCAALSLTLASEPDRHAPQPLLEFLRGCWRCSAPAAATLLLKHLSARYSPFILTAMQAFIGSIFFLPLAMLSAGTPAVPSGRGLFAPWSTWAAWSRWAPMVCTTSGSVACRRGRPRVSST
jgi:hypothetical protein